MRLRREIIELSTQEGANRRALCRRFGISPKTACKWLRRARQPDAPDLVDRSRRPHHSPARTVPVIEAAVLGVRAQHPAWGGRKIARRLADLAMAHLAPSTVTGILHRHGCLTEATGAPSVAWVRVEHPEPNQLWQIDFKGYFDTARERCHPLTLLDDHSRFNLTLHACQRTGASSIEPLLSAVFRRYGLPVRINGDNGAPWGAPREAAHGLSRLVVWLIRIGVSVSHSRPYHPQTNGKDERFHRSLQAEVLNGRGFADLAAVQRAFDDWRTVYNCERPHEALGLATPASRYRPSPREFPEQLPAIEYGPNDTVYRVPPNGWLRIAGRRVKVSNALTGLPIGVRSSTTEEGVLDFYFCHQRFMRWDLRQPGHRE